MSLQPIPIDIPLIDSLSLLIPLDECVIIDKRIITAPVNYYPDLDEYDDYEKPYEPIIINPFEGVKIVIAIQQSHKWNSETQKQEPFTQIRLTVNAKLLKSRYFEGVTLHNVRYFYDQFISYQIFTCDFDTFLNGYVNDIDICSNLYVPHYNVFVDALRKMKIQSGTKSGYFKLINEPTNTGLSINFRRSAKPSFPHVKLYHKEIELLNRSTQFWNTYLFKHYGNQIKNLVRLECTIKNYAHKQRLAKYKILPMFKSLKELLEIPKPKLKQFLNFSVNSYILPTYRIPSPNLSPTEHILFNCFQDLLIQGLPQSHILAYMDTFKGNDEKSTAVQKSRSKKKIKQLLDLLLMKDLKLQKQDQYNQHIHSFLKQIGL